MGRYSLSTPEERAEFHAKYMPAGYEWRVNPVGDTTAFSKPEAGEFAIYTSLFVDAGLRLPLDPLLVDFLRTTRMSLAECGINVVRLILGVAELNRQFGTSLGLDEIFYCYSIVQHDKGGCYLKAQPNAPELVKALPTSQKGKFCDAIVILKGAITPDGRPLPKFGSLVGRKNFVPFLLFPGCFLYLSLWRLILGVVMQKNKLGLRLIKSEEGS